MLKFAVAVMLFSLSASAVAQCLPVSTEQPLPKGPLTIAKIEFVRNDIFDLQAPNALWFHRFANQYHVVTTEGTLRDDVLFVEGDTLDPTELAETERLLRSRRYLRHAEVTVSHYCAEQSAVIVTVKSWDNWSLLPKIDIGHEGGETKTSIGFAEDNLLGSGNQLQAEYYNDSERDGFQLRFVSPNIFGHHWRTSMFYADNSDGESYLFNLEKPFYRLNSERAYGFTMAKTIKDISEYTLGDEVNEYQSKTEFLNVHTGWKISQQRHVVQHLLVGATLDESQFAANDQSIWPVPVDRDLSRLWLGWELLESDYQKLQNFFLFNRTEDINFGWQANIRLGRLIPGLGASSGGWHWQAQLEKNWALSDHDWLVFSNEYHRLDASDLPKQQRFSSHIRYIRHLSAKQVWISQLRLSLGKNLFRDQLVAIGGDDGMRAFPLYYQTGNKAVIASACPRCVAYISAAIPLLSIFSASC